MEISSEVDARRRAALIARWKSPQGCAARARVLSLHRSRKVQFMAGAFTGAKLEGASVALATDFEQMGTSSARFVLPPGGVRQ
jgi:hypothetical protein